MKKLISSFLLSVFLCSTAYAQVHYFNSLKDAKNDYALSRGFLSSLKQTFGIETFIETGTYAARTTLIAADLFREVHTYEIDATLYKAAQAKLQSLAHVTIVHGDSSVELYKLLPKINSRSLFWLDAHYSGPGTGQNQKQEHILLSELRAIAQYVHDCVILIDDTTYIPSGTQEDMNMERLVEALREINPSFSFALFRGILLAYDATKHFFDVSPVVKACGTQRTNFSLSIDELAQTDKIIAKAQGVELESLEILHTVAKKSVGLHDSSSLFWYALALMKQKKYAQAKESLDSMINKYTVHPRVIAYRDLCQATLSERKNYDSIDAFIDAALEIRS